MDGSGWAYSSAGLLAGLVAGFAGSVAPGGMLDGLLAGWAGRKAGWLGTFSFCAPVRSRCSDSRFEFRRHCEGMVPDGGGVRTSKKMRAQKNEKLPGAFRLQGAPA